MGTPEEDRMDMTLEPRAMAVQAPSILVCEDSPVVRLYIRRTLENAWPGASIHEAADGREGLSVMKGHKIDLIVTDLQMEGMDGDSFLHLLKRNGVLAKKPVLVLSGMITQDLRNEYAQRTDVAFLAKPASSEKLIEASKRLMGVQA
jgi:two-component system, chemotaxis family, chemotaxis protein CheY